MPDTTAAKTLLESLHERRPRFDNRAIVAAVERETAPLREAFGIGSPDGATLSTNAFVLRRRPPGSPAMRAALANDPALARLRASFFDRAAP